VSLLECDDRIKVVVFDSAVDGFFLTHYDLLAKPEESAKFPVGRTGLQALPDMLARLSRAPVVSIASIRGRATGVGSELALASDLRFASREKVILSQWEVGAALVPGGGPMARLPRLMGRGRALEVLLGADKVNGDLAQLYGYVNRSLIDSTLSSTRSQQGLHHSMLELWVSLLKSPPPEIAHRRDLDEPKGKADLSCLTQDFVAWP
jgi:enoyl-CoA hydratase/carnithine racemase